MRISQKVVLANTVLALSCLILVVWYLLGQGETDAFSTAGFMPHGHCYLWTPALVWTMVLTDSLIGLAYVSISICLYILVRRIRLPLARCF